MTCLSVRDAPRRMSIKFLPPEKFSNAPIESPYKKYPSYVTATK